MTTAKQLRMWAATIRTLLAEHGTRLITELEALAACEEVMERQFV